MRRPTCSAATPWGTPRTTQRIAPGIVWYSTAAHGGYHVSPARLAEMPEDMRPNSTGEGWFEEDCDWSLVVTAFPQYFEADRRDLAKTILREYHPEVYARLYPDGAP